ncbi:site-specific integrase [Agrobacterium sp. CMT1]|uniref:site-specific integrase n=1 Tax=Agrobacterium sp. CMT1 TaxID=3128901 RepID=UPI003FCE90B4
MFENPHFHNHCAFAGGLSNNTIDAYRKDLEEYLRFLRRNESHATHYKKVILRYHLRVYTFSLQ